VAGRITIVRASYGAELVAAEVPSPRPLPRGAATLLLAHGWCLDHTSWHKVVDEVRSRREVRIVVYDQRGHGKSTMGEDEEPSVRILGDDLFQIIHGMCPDAPLVLAGHSMGGMSIMAYAGLHYDDFTARVRGTVLASTAASIEGRHPVPMERLIMAVASRAPGIPPRLLVPRLVQGRLMFGADADNDDVRHAVHLIQRTKMPTIGRFFYAIAKHDEMDALEHFVDVPTHIITGNQDRLIPPAHAAALQERIPGATMTVVPDAGHMTIYEAPEVIAEALVDLLDSPT
jgi:pimeloyl-ACP methyl ester carboxylesterase